MEKKMKRYPYIGKGKHSGAVFLFVGKCEALTVHQGSESRYSTFETDIEEDLCTNITPEYLQNTYGEVVSPEHAEFIIELAESAGFELFCAFSNGHDHFLISETELIFTYGEPVVDSADKQITIPLPPKADSKKWTPDFYDLGEPPRHFDCVCNKCGGKCCTGQCDKQELSEWPQVGDKVCWSNGCYKGVVKARHWNDLWVMESCGEFSTLYIDDVSKPKTPEEELRDDIEYAIHHFEGDKVAGRKWLMNKYDIKKKPQ